MLAENVVHFARILRGAGIPIGTDKVMDAVHALPLTGLERRGDWHATLSALFLTRHEQQPIFDDAFARFWRDPALEERMRAMLLPKVEGRTPKDVCPCRRAPSSVRTRRRERRVSSAPPWPLPQPPGAR